MVGPVALIIGLITIRGYWIFRNWKFLFLSMAFLLISIGPMFDWLTYLGFLVSLRIYPFWQYQTFKFGVSMAAFMLLAFIYTDEHRTSSIKVSKLQWIAVAYPTIAYA